MPVQSVFFGCSGLVLTAVEIAFFKAVKPAGYILFARNCSDPEQLKALTKSLADLCDVTPAPILIDQEGGRVARLRPPQWLGHPPAATIGALYQDDKPRGLEAAKAQGALIGAELRDLGITVDCLPVLDVLFPQTHDIIGDRAFGSNAESVTALGAAMVSGILGAGVVPVIKHIPGHGRATTDSHLDLPIVDASHDALSSIDFRPFKALSLAPMAMTAHILYTALDGQNCATHSASIIADVIRGEIGFDGLLMSDDLSMKALGGSLTERAEKALGAGCDIALHCNGDMAEMRAVAAGCKPLSRASERRLQSAMALVATRGRITVAEALEQRSAVFGDVWTA